MNARSPGAFMLSATFHAAVIVIVLLFAYVADQGTKVTPKVLELVAGEGDNYGATAAPKLGTPGGVKVDIPAPPTPKAEPTPAPMIKEETPPPEPVTTPPPPKPQAKPTPKTPPPTQTKPAEQAVPNFKRQILHKVWAAEAKAKKEVAKERAEEEKRLRKEEFDRRQKSAAAALARANPKITHIDGEGIAKGVVGGSAENKIGGAGGRALTRSDGSLMEAYDALLKQRVLHALEKPPGISDDLVVTVVVHISASGRLSNARVTKSSGSEEFDRAVITACNRVEMPEHPEHRSEDVEMDFRTKDAG